MGRLFENELKDINKTYLEGMAAETTVIEHFLGVNAPVLVIGSGGSFSVARMMEYFLGRVSVVAKAITPLQLEEHRNVICQSKVILVTARGNNPDILNAFQYCDLLECKAILVVCCSTKSRLRKFIRQNGHQFLWEKDMSFGKDGYLSVNSMVAMITIMAKAIYRFSGDDYFKLSENMNFDELNTMPEKYDSMEVLKKSTIIVLHGGATTPVAMDMESKFSEAALGNIQLVDYRNFAHGRHFWLSKRGNETGVVAFIDSEQKMIAEKTLAFVPDGIPVCVIETEDYGVPGIFKLYGDLFRIVYSAGKMNDINPGKPQVADYGKKLYHIQYRSTNLAGIKKINKNPDERAAYRKSGMMQENAFFQHYQAGANIFLQKLITKTWRCLIFDYDGTLHWKGDPTETEKAIFERLNCFLQSGCRLAISTGRGKSVRLELQGKIAKEFWKEVAIGYYNGGVCGWLDDDTMPQESTEPECALTDLYENLKDNALWRSCFAHWEAPKPKQWSLIFDDCAGISSAFDILSENVELNPTLKMVSSSHSVDIIGKDTSKRKVLDLIQARWGDIHTEDCLFIGDAGQQGGNDFEMLCYNGLSVDRVSKNNESCFNFAPLGMRQLEATRYYLEHIESVEKGSCKINLI